MKRTPNHQPKIILEIRGIELMGAPPLIGGRGRLKPQRKFHLIEHQAMDGRVVEAEYSCCVDGSWCFLSG